ncbi:MAG: hypothetical protein JWM05_1892 [Acidimicrobiales bacterium]|nr:hypothetical protein [Acidimicrobiales bacterium]
MQPSGTHAARLQWLTMTTTGPAPIENCDECGFGWHRFTDERAVDAIPLAGAFYRGVLEGVDIDLANTRPAPDSWSILEYVDHVRRAMWIWQFVVDVAVHELGVDLTNGSSPDIGPEVQRFDDIESTISTMDSESAQLSALLAGLAPDQWACAETVSLGVVDQHWVVRHALHEMLHHLHDVGRVRARLGDGAPTQTGSVAQLNIGSGGVPKGSVAEAVVTFEGMIGDHQNDRANHGRPFQALSLYSNDVIEALKSEGHPIHAGAAGENITVDGIDWASLRPGALVSIGPEVMIEVSAYATPCAKNAQWFVDRDFNRMNHDSHPGWSRLYATVLAPGRLRHGDRVVVEP